MWGIKQIKQLLDLSKTMLFYVSQLIESVSSWEYLILNVLGVLVIMAFGYHAARKNTFTWFSALIYTAGIPLVFLIGIRLAYLFFYADINDPVVHFLDLKLYGFSLYGGLILVVAYSVIVAWLSRIPVWNWLDFHGIGVMGYVALGKTGCFLNGCCFGSPTLMPWGINYASDSHAYHYYMVQAFNHISSHAWTVYSDRIHPVQLYEVIIAVALLITGYQFLRRKVLPGTFFLLCAALYSLARLGLLFLRANPVMGPHFYALPWLYVTVAGLSVGILLVRLYFQYKSVNRGSRFK